MLKRALTIIVGGALAIGGAAGLVIYHRLLAGSGGPDYSRLFSEGILPYVLGLLAVAGGLAVALGSWGVRRRRA